MPESSIPWNSDFIGIAYRYYDLRMNVALLFEDRKIATDLWNEVIHWWSNHSIKIRFVEIEDEYWFIMSADTSRPSSNQSFYKILPKSANYERFKKGHDGEAYLRLGVYSEKTKSEVKDDAICNCGHAKEDHEEGDGDECLYEDCDCKLFESFQVNLLKKKKTVTDILFLQEDEVKDDPLTWNCLYVNKYSKLEKSN